MLRLETLVLIGFCTGTCLNDINSVQPGSGLFLNELTDKESQGYVLGPNHSPQKTSTSEHRKNYLNSNAAEPPS